jgi:hypothetical protein
MKKLACLMVYAFISMTILTSCTKKPVYSVPTQAEVTKFICRQIPYCNGCERGG